MPRGQPARCRRSDIYLGRGFRLAVYQPVFVLPLLFGEKVAQSVNVVTEALGQLTPHRSDFCDDRIFRCGFHACVEL